MPKYDLECEPTVTQFAVKIHEVDETSYTRRDISALFWYYFAIV